MTTTTQLPIPTHFDPSRVGELWRVPYQERAAQAKQWAKAHQISPGRPRQTPHLPDGDRCAKHLLHSRL
jgi:hypothetical protein